MLVDPYYYYFTIKAICNRPIEETVTIKAIQSLNSEYRQENL